MSLSPAEDIHQKIFKVLLQDSAITTLLGGAKVYDRVPDRSKPPYLVIGDMTGTDWSTFTEPGEAINFSLHTWSKERDREQAHDLVQLIKTALTSNAFDLVDHHLVNLRCLFTEIRREVRTGLVHGILRFRAVTEPRTQ